VLGCFLASGSGACLFSIETSILVVSAIAGV
jgi:hypothetical protein